MQKKVLTEQSLYYGDVAMPKSWDIDRDKLQQDILNSEITNSQKIHKEILEIELNISQKYIDNLLDTITKDLLDKKNTAFNSLDTIVQSLSVEIETRLSI